MNPAMIEELADFFKTLGDPVRLGLMLRLKENEITVSELASSSKTSVANVSKHLALMRQAGLLERRKRGNQVYYAIRNRNVFEICDAICGSIRESFASRHAGLADLPGLADMSRNDPEGLAPRLKGDQ